jgi:hypothetical protein
VLLLFVPEIVGNSDPDVQEACIGEASALYRRHPYIVRTWKGWRHWRRR